MKTIGEILKEEREKRGKTQQWIANKIKVSREYYSDVERDRYTPSLKILARLAVLFDLDLNFLKQNVGDSI